MDNKTVDTFLDSWGSMGSLWGINRSVARVHGLLLVTDKSWSLDEISGRLGISRGNVSMCLKELRSWNVIRNISKHNDRKEYFTCEPDVWQMLFNIMKERKRREFDPLVASVTEALAAAEEEPAGIDVERLRQLGRMLTLFERLAAKSLSSGEKARTVISFIEGRV